MLYRHGHTFFTRKADDAADADVTAGAVQLTDDTPEDKQSYGAVFSFTLADGVSPTLDASVLTSWDGVHYLEAAAMTQLTDNGSNAEFQAIEALGPYTKVVVTGGGSTKASWFGSVRLASTGVVRVFS